MERDEELRCEGCQRRIDDCVCVCRYCAASEECTCAVGPDAVTGG